MFCNDSVLKFSPDVLNRYESNLDGGTYFLYNTENNEFWIGNNSSHKILIFIDGINKTENVYQKAKELFKSSDINVIKNSVDVLLFELFQKGFLHILNEGN